MTPDAPSTGAQRARDRLLKKLRALPPKVEGPPSRQVLRRHERKSRKHRGLGVGPGWWAGREEN